MTQQQIEIAKQIEALLYKLQVADIWSSDRIEQQIDSLVDQMPDDYEFPVIADVRCNLEVF